MKHTEHMLTMCWKDKCEVFMLSTAHNSTITQQSGNCKWKPEVIFQYNSNMGLVDKSDMQISFTESIRKTLKWYKKLFLHYLDITIYNSYNLYKTTKNVDIQLSEFCL